MESKLDTVVLTRDLPEHGLKKKDIGAVVRFSIFRQSSQILLFTKSFIAFPSALMLRMGSPIKVGSKLYRLIDEVATSHEPIIITGKRGSAVLISEDDWRAIQETMYLLNIPGMRDSIREGLVTPIEECTRELDW
jgi:prevent-host-death family protein